jgi:small subunit ribosomal protein S9
MAYYYGLGRRKKSTARVRLQKGKGQIEINGTPVKDYLATSQHLLHELERPFIALEQENNFDIKAKVSGGGHGGQVDAIRLGIAKALVELNPDFKQTLRRAELLGRDPRAKERKKFGLKGARKKQQYTKR